MEEAKYSLNIRFNVGGYDSQFTARDDESGVKLLNMVPVILQELEKLGAVPERRWEDMQKNGNGNGHISSNEQQNGAAGGLQGHGKREVRPVPKPSKNGPEPMVPPCPVHGWQKVRQSKFGGYFCACKNGDGSFCTWKVAEGEWEEQLSSKGGLML